MVKDNTSVAGVEICLRGSGGNQVEFRILDPPAAQITSAVDENITD